MPRDRAPSRAWAPPQGPHWPRRVASHRPALPAWPRARPPRPSRAGAAQATRWASEPVHRPREVRSIPSATAPRPTWAPAPWGRHAPGRARCADRAPRSVDLARGRRGPESQVPRLRTSGSTAARESAGRAAAQAPMTCVHGERQHLHQPLAPARLTGTRDLALPLRSRSCSACGPWRRFSRIPANRRWVAKKSGTAGTIRARGISMKKTTRHAFAARASRCPFHCRRGPAVRALPANGLRACDLT